MAQSSASLTLGTLGVDCCRIRWQFTPWASNCWRNIAISLTIAETRILSVTAFHEKAGRSQVDSSWFW